MSQLLVDDIVDKDGGNSVGFSKGINVGASSTVTGNLNVTGVLTYEDVTNVDSVGLITARSGIKFGAAGVGGTIRANGDTTLAGVVTATSFSGAATGLTGVPGGQITGALAAVDGSALTGMANTANVSTSGLNVTGIATIGVGLTLADNVRAKFGNDGDLAIYHNASNSFIVDNGTGPLYIRGNDAVRIESYTNDSAGEPMVIANSDGSVDLYFNNSKKFETHNTGIRVTGIATVTSNIYINTNGSSIAENNLNFRSAGKAYIDHGTTGQDIDFRMSHGSALDRTAITIGSAGVSTFYDTPHDDIGSLRSIPLQDESSTANYILVASDAGQCVHAHTSTTQVTVNPSVFSAGDAVSIVNGSGGNITLTQGTSMTIRNTADSSTGSKTLASFGMCTLWFSGHNVAYLSGAGLS